jgi:hypothetical protein
MASAMSDKSLLIYFLKFLLIDILNMKTVVCQFVSPLDAQTLPVDD